MSLYNDKRIAWLKRVFPRVQEYALRKWLMIHTHGVIYGVDKFHIVREGE